SQAAKRHGRFMTAPRGHNAGGSSSTQVSDLTTRGPVRATTWQFEKIGNRAAPACRACREVGVFFRRDAPYNPRPSRMIRAAKRLNHRGTEDTEKTRIMKQKTR